MKNPVPAGQRDDDVDYGNKRWPKEPYRDRSQTHRAARRLRHRNYAAEVLPSRYHVTLDEDTPVSPGYGVIRIETDVNETMPVFAVNGEPVAMGHGTIRVSVPEGTHRVEAQNTVGIDPVVVTLGDGAEEPVYYWEHQYTDESYFGSVKREYRDNSMGTVLIGMFIASVAFFLPVNLMPALVGSDSIGDLLGSTWYMAAPVVVFGSLLPFSIKRRRRDKANRTGDEKRLAQPMHSYPWGEPPLSSTPVLVGAQRRQLPAPDPSLGALLMCFSLDRHLWLSGEEKTERAGDLSRLWIAPPRLCIDGVEHVATWGTWWYPLGQGEHIVEVDVEGLPVNAESIMRTDPVMGKTRSLTFEISPRTVTSIVVEGHTYAVKRDSEIEYFQPRLWVEPALPGSALPTLVDKAERRAGLTGA